MKQNNFFSKFSRKFSFNFLFLFLATFVLFSFSFVQADNTGPGSITVNVPAGYAGTGTVTVTVTGNNSVTGVYSAPVNLTINPVAVCPEVSISGVRGVNSARGDTASAFL